MFATNVRNLKKNPSHALRQAEIEPVLILKGDEPNALLIHLDKSMMADDQQLRPAIAASLFKDGTLSLGAAARMSALSLNDFIDHLASLGIDLVQRDETSSQETEDCSAWLAS